MCSSMTHGVFQPRTSWHQGWWFELKTHLVVRGNVSMWFYDCSMVLLHLTPVSWLLLGLCDTPVPPRHGDPVSGGLPACEASPESARSGRTMGVSIVLPKSGIVVGSYGRSRACLIFTRAQAGHTQSMYSFGHGDIVLTISH